MIQRPALLLPSVFATTLLACGGSTEATGSSSAAAASAPAKSAAPPAASSAAKPATPPKPAGVKTTGEVELREGNKKASFSIELPEGLKDVSETPAVKSYRKEKDKFDAYGFSVMGANPTWVKGGMDGTLGELEKDPDFKKNKVKILDKGKTDSGWYFTHSLEEGGGKKAVSATVIVTKGEASLQCQGEVEGALADKPEESAKAMLEACKTLTITAP